MNVGTVPEPYELWTKVSESVYSRVRANNSMWGATEDSNVASAQGVARYISKSIRVLLEEDESYKQIVRLDSYPFTPAEHTYIDLLVVSALDWGSKQHEAFQHKSSARITTLKKQALRKAKFNQFSAVQQKPPSTAKVWAHVVLMPWVHPEKWRDFMDGSRNHPWSQTDKEIYDRSVGSMTTTSALFHSQA
jgi:hypothetical protein